MQYTFEDFKNTKIAVRISKQSQLVWFLGACDKYGVSFIHGNEDAKEWCFDWKHKDVVLICRMGNLTWQYDDDPLPFDVRECVRVTEVLCRPVEEAAQKTCPIPEYQIIITCWGDTTHADMFVNGHKVKETKAKRNPADKFNWRIGAQTAFNRLWEKKKSKKPVNKYAQLFNEKLMECAKDEVEKIFRRFDRLPPVVREVKRNAKPGEWVKIVEADGYPDETYKTGDVLKVKSMYEGEEGWVYLEGHEECACGTCEYVVLEGYKPE